MTLTQCKEKVAQIAKKLYERGMVNTNEGNVSIYDGHNVYITPSQVSKEILTPDMIAVCDFDGNQIDGALPVSSETGMHIHIYKLRKDIRAVVHTHSPFATGFALNRLPIASDSYTEMMFLYDKIPVVKYGLMGTPAVSEGIAEYIFQTDVFLLANHGLVAVGDDADNAFRKAESAESVAKTLVITKILGGGYSLSPEDQQEIYQARQKKLGKGRILP